MTLARLATGDEAPEAFQERVENPGDEEAREDEQGAESDKDDDDGCVRRGNGDGQRGEKGKEGEVRVVTDEVPGPPEQPAKVVDDGLHLSTVRMATVMRKAIAISTASLKGWLNSGRITRP